VSGAFLGALVSASPLFNYGNLTRHLKENLNIPRHSAALLAPAFLMFARAGTAMITSICMLSIIRSYSSLEITLFQASWTAVFSFLVSFALPATPDRGLTASLIMLGALYGRGLSDGWLILVPALPLIAMLSAVLDTAAAALILLLINRKAGLEEADSAAAMRF
jgi:Na+/H+-dicarboxylate symporter